MIPVLSQNMQKNKLRELQTPTSRTNFFDELQGFLTQSVFKDGINMSIYSWNGLSLNGIVLFEEDLCKYFTLPKI
jgi:hypothetical protein